VRKERSDDPLNMCLKKDDRAFMSESSLEKDLICFTQTQCLFLVVEL